ncbi:hypothetical protein [Aridibaculum aurantiacum]|uniref:hypothetical protein n=1 Tax=Aridibaculum aurantiacum TaxID=2810307 RepID=UPI001A959C4F|nr:hypothetical protein [Aridibaculum aurantiacum]
MAALSISETQFAFTYFHKFSLLNRKQSYHFVFPTLKQEGNPLSGYAGADIVISKNLFIQFKVPEYLKTGGTLEFYNYNARDLFDPPFFRMRVKNKLLNGKPNSGQYQMLQRAARSGKSAQYIFPVFNNEFQNDKRDDADYWFKDFFDLEPSTSMQRYCISVDFSDMLTPEFDLDNVDTHTLCTDYKTGMGDGDIYLFSEAKHVNARKFNSALTYDNILNWEEEGDYTIRETEDQVREIFEINQKFESLSEIQSYLLSFYDIYWMPIVKIAA